jgi:hypothetical protein
MQAAGQKATNFMLFLQKPANKNKKCQFDVIQACPEKKYAAAWRPYVH